MKMNRKYVIFAMTMLMLTGCGSNVAETAETVEINNAADAAPEMNKADAAAEAEPETFEAAPAAALEGATGGDYEAAADEGIAAAKRALSVDAKSAEDLKTSACMDDTDGECSEEEPPVDIKPDIEPPVYDPAAAAMILTAGEWKDNENWGFFANLVHNDTISFPAYGLDPTGRVAVTVTHDGAAVQNQAVMLNDDDKHIWKAKTDQNGIAYLFFDADYAGKTLQIETNQAEMMPVEIPANFVGSQGGKTIPTLEVTVETGAKSEKYTDTQVMFILDTTGSMGDEITYLQKDFSAIAEETNDGHTTFSVNFYRDEGDDYVTRCYPFSNDIKDVQRKLNAEYADGGGDIPEAVAEILDETMHSGDWQENANKIAFLIFDAPPHSGSEYEEQILDAVAAAAEKGIRLVPVVASNAERDTELFGRALSIMTGSSYVFLTDHSGVGGSHLEPIIGAYDVELLHDIIVRNIRTAQGITE